MSDRVAGKVIMMSVEGGMGLAKLSDASHAETYQFMLDDILSGGPLKEGQAITFRVNSVNQSGYWTYYAKEVRGV